MAALIIGVIVAGLGIGALVSAFQNRAAVPDLGPTSIPAVTPVPQPSAPAPVITLPPTAPPPVPTLTPKPAPTHSPKPKPSHTPAAAPTQAGASPSPAHSAVPLTLASAKPVLAASPEPPAVHPAPVPTRPAVAAAVPGEPAAAVVRRYLDDLIAGDEAGAYAALGGTRSDRSLDLKEEAFLTKDARITSVHVNGTDATGSTVDAEITTGRGSYVASFHVTTGPNGSIINQHDYIKI